MLNVKLRHSELSKEQQRKVLMLRKAGLSIKRIAKTIHVCDKRVSQYLNESILGSPKSKEPQIEKNVISDKVRDFLVSFITDMEAIANQILKTGNTSYNTYVLKKNILDSQTIRLTNLIEHCIGLNKKKEAK